MIRPVFSVIMPTYNAELTVKESVESVLMQSFSDFELIVIDDCSTDKTRSVVESLQEDSRVKLVSLFENLGVAGARNRGIEKALGRYIAFLDSDDIWLSNKLELQKRVLDSGCPVVFSSYKRFDENGEKELVRAKSPVSYKDMLYGNKVGNLTGVYDCSLLGKFYQKKIGHEDYLMWLEIIEKSGLAIGVEDVLAKYRVAKESISGNKLKSSVWVWHIYRKHLKIGFFQSVKFFVFYVVSNVLRRL